MYKTKIKGSKLTEKKNCSLDVSVSFTALKTVPQCVWKHPQLHVGVLPYLGSKVRSCDRSPSRMPGPFLHWSFIIPNLWRSRLTLTRKSTCAISLLSFWKSFSETLFERPFGNKVATLYGFLAKNGKTELDWWTQKSYKLWKTVML